VLRAAQRRIGSPERWVQGTMIEHGYERDVPPIDTPLSKTFVFNYRTIERACALGAIAREVSASQVLDADAFASCPAVEALWEALPMHAQGIAPNQASDVTHFNDKHSHDEVMMLFARAIAIAEAWESEGVKVRKVVPQATPRRRDNVACDAVEEVLCLP
jgi:hypothetical protein